MIHYCFANLMVSHASAFVKHQIFTPQTRAGIIRRISSPSPQVRMNHTRLNSKEDASRKMGQMKQKLQKSVSREDRISALEIKLKRAESMSDSESVEHMTKAERAELKGLLEKRETFEEQYDPLSFTQEHLEFKAMHNNVFIQLAKYCQEERDKKELKKERINVFFLDGPDGGTASALIDTGEFQASQCYVANRHESSCESLRNILPDENVIHAAASKALNVAAPIVLDGVKGTSAGEIDVDVSLSSEKDGAFANIDFAAYYFDGCGGFVPHIIGMISAALVREDYDSSAPIAIGYSLLGGNKDVVEKELTISQALSTIASSRNMRLCHCLDDPARFNIPQNVKKIGGGSGSGTFTTWMLIEPCNI